MNKNTIDIIEQLSANDTKSLSQKALKAAEEIGELAKVVLPFEGAHATTHRFVDRQRILEEAVDAYLCVRSVAYDLGYSESDWDEMVIAKAKKWAELQARERNAKYPVPYEFHITVRTHDVERFKAICTLVGTKAIVLDLQDQQGQSVLTDVMTSSTFLGDNPGAYAEMERIVDELTKHGFEVVRKKIETAPWHPAAPSKAHVNPTMPKDCYFETHFGVLCTEARRDDLHKVAQDMGAHLSRNVFKRLDDETFKIMLTARRYEGTREDFEKYVKTVQAALDLDGFEVDKIIVEFSVYDTKVNHDASWIMATT